MPSLKRPGRSAGNLQLNANTSVTFGLVFVILGVAGTAIYKAGEVVSDLSNLKSNFADFRSEFTEVKRIIQRIDRHQNNGAGR